MQTEVYYKWIQMVSIYFSTFVKVTFNFDAARYKKEHWASKASVKDAFNLLS